MGSFLTGVFMMLDSRLYPLISPTDDPEKGDSETNPRRRILKYVIGGALVIFVILLIVGVVLYGQTSFDVRPFLSPLAGGDTPKAADSSLKTVLGFSVPNSILHVYSLAKSRPMVTGIILGVLLLSVVVAVSLVFMLKQPDVLEVDDTEIKVPAATEENFFERNKLAIIILGSVVGGIVIILLAIVGVNYWRKPYIPPVKQDIPPVNQDIPPAPQQPPPPLPPGAQGTPPPGAQGTSSMPPNTPRPDIPGSQETSSTPPDKLPPDIPLAKGTPPDAQVPKSTPPPPPPNGLQPNPDNDPKVLEEQPNLLEQIRDPSKRNKAVFKPLNTPATRQVSVYTNIFNAIKKKRVDKKDDDEKVDWSEEEEKKD
jgi:hypothetical protein